MQADGKRELATGPNPNHEGQLMTQAADTVNLNRLSYSSAGGPRRRAFPVETASFDKSSGDIRGAHADLIRRLEALPPYRFDPRLQATPEQLELQAETLRCNL